MTAGDHGTEIARLRADLETLAATHARLSSQEIQQVLVEMALARQWNEGFWSRLKFWINVVGMLGIVSTAILAAVHFLGWSFVRQ